MSVAVPKPQLWMLTLISFGIPLSCWGALYPQNTWLQVGPVALTLPLVVFALRRWPISNAAANCIFVFVLFHLLAARWSYSFVPYREWISWVYKLSDQRIDRNMFDRFVHFMFGLLAILPVTEIFVRYAGLKERMALVVAMLFVLAAGGLYEIFEWGLTFALSPADAGAYNGEQGDRFDSQKDMAIAAMGALIAVIPVAKGFRRWLA